MLEGIKDNWWYTPNDPDPGEPDPEPVLAWRGTGYYCVQESGENTGYYSYTTLEEYDTATGAATGTTKPNESSDPDYIAPVEDNNACPLTEYEWEGYEPYCVTESADSSQPPVENCRVHFSGLIMSDNTIPPPQDPGVTSPDDESAYRYTKIYEEDTYSEFVGAGNYPDNELAFPKAVQTTFDGIAIDANTRVIIYSGKNYSGSVLLDITGPALLYNNKWATATGSYAEHYRNDKQRTFSEPLQSTYPQNKRYWSGSDMHDWNTGSCKIICS